MIPIDVIRPILEDVLINEPMSHHTSFRIGGPAEVFARPKTATELTRIWEDCRKYGIPLTILGDGTNVLVADEGIKGVVVTTSNIRSIEILGEGRIRVQAGARLAKMADEACKAGLDGMAFASGIPGTIGGAVYMNAGAYDHDIGEFIETVTMLTSDSLPVVKTKEEMGFGYRESIVQKDKALVLDAIFKLAFGEPTEIREKMTELNNRRRTTQPLESPSAGSTFKRPPGNFAGALIQKSGLKGLQIGGAKVSEKHAGFIINTGGATAKDVMGLIEAVRNRVYENSGVWLEPEIKVLGS